MFKKARVQEPDLNCYVIYDSKSQSYRDPIWSVNDEVLVRTIINEFTDDRFARTDMFVNAEDFSIFKVAHYDRKNGSLTALAAPQHVANCIELRSLAARKMRDMSEIRSSMAVQALNQQPSLANLQSNPGASEEGH